MILRRFLTALALITGLAATGAPAHVAAAEAMSAEAQAETSGSSARQNADCVCVLQRGLDPMKRISQRACTPRRKPVVIYIPTVQFGADRAFE